MRKVFGIGESVLDIIFKDGRPLNAVPGGSTFNCMVSLGRCELPSFFIGETGDDKVGDLVKKFMQDNKLSTQYLGTYENGKSSVALAFLDDHNNAEYLFYQHSRDAGLNQDFPVMNKDDIVIFGSYFAVNPILRNKVQSFLEDAERRDAIIYYDINFRKAHAHELFKLNTFFIENFEFADIIRCSDEDLSVLYPKQQIEEVYRDRISFYTKIFIVTMGSKGVWLKTSKFSKTYQVPLLTPTNTIGAGDNFNAGLIYGLYHYEISSDHLNELTEEEWDKIIGFAIAFASEVCDSDNNYVSEKFVNQLKAV